METTAETARPTSRRLTRRTDEKMVAGVAAGLGRYFDVDPVLFRIGFVVAVFAGGAGLLAYALAWLVIPKAGQDASEAERMFRGPDQDRTRTWLGIGLLVLGASLLAGQIGWWHPEVVWGAALIAIGVVLFRQDARRPQPPGSTPYESSSTEPSTDEALAVPSQGEGAETTALHTTSVTPRTRSVLGWLTAGAALIAVGLASALVDLELVSLEVGQFFGIALAVVGAGLVAGAWWGRARWLIAIGLLLAPLTIAASVVRVPFEGGVGERFYNPQSAVDVRDEYRLGVGELRIDLNDVAFSGQTVDAEASVVAGRIEVIVPNDVTVDVRGKVGIGQLVLFGHRQEGTELDTDSVSGSGGVGTLHLDLETSFGEVVVRRATAAE